MRCPRIPGRPTRWPPRGQRMPDQRHHQVRVHPDRPARGPSRPVDLGQDRPQGVVVARRDEDQIGIGDGEFVHRGRVRQRRHHRLALRWPRGDGRALDREVLAGEVDVVQLVAVDIATGDDIADDGVVFPAVPKPARHLHGVGRLVEQLVHPGDRPPPEQRRFLLGRAHPHLPTGPAVRDMVKRGNRFRHVERLGMGDRRHGNQADVFGDRRYPGRHQGGVGASHQSPRRDLGPAARLRVQAVVDGQEIQQAAFGGAGQRRPVSTAELTTAGGVVRERVSPRLGVPAVPVQRHG